jgi:hypothetical protein
MFDILPQELISEIFEYDETYRIRYVSVVFELLELSGLLRFVYMYAYDIVTSEKTCKKFLRFVTKSQIRRLAYFTKTRLPRKFTKRRGLLGIVFNTIYKPSMRHKKFRSMIT